MKTLPAEIPVVIVGAGPTGLLTANLLAAYGVESIIVEKNAAPMDIPRAIVLDDEGARAFQVFGADKTYVAKTIEAVGSKYFDDNGVCFAETGAGPQTYGFPKRLYINQPELEHALHRHIESNPLITMRFASELMSLEEKETGIEVLVRDAEGQSQVTKAQFVAACDGGRSPIREHFGIQVEGSTYQQDWIVIDTHNDPDQSRFSRFFCSTTRPHVSIPAPNGGRRYEFMLLPDETHEQVLEEKFIDDLLAPYRKIDQQDIIRKTIYTFHARVAERFRIGRTLLLGDAAHLTPPFAGQGMNAGLRDAWNVAWKLAAILKGGASHDILDTYYEERRDPAWAMIQLAVVMGDLVMPIEQARVIFREQLLLWLQPFPQVRDYLLQMKFKPRPRYANGLFLDLDDQPFDGSLVGEMIPQPLIRYNGTEQKLDQFMGSGFCLIAQDDAGENALAAFELAEYLGFALKQILLNWKEDDKENGRLPSYGIADRNIAKPLRTHRDQILLIRPDRYCAAAIEPDELAEKLAKYAELF